MALEEGDWRNDYLLIENSVASPVHENSVVGATEFTIPEDLDMHLEYVEHISYFPSALSRPMFSICARKLAFIIADSTSSKQMLKSII